MEAIDRVVECPECHTSCGWCAWYAKEARKVGCGCPRSPSGRKVSCAWGESLKGTACGTCGGSEKARLVGYYVAERA
jgi:hypothetical protein